MNRKRGKYIKSRNKTQKWLKTALVLFMFLLTGTVALAAGIDGSDSETTNPVKHFLQAVAGDECTGAYGILITKEVVFEDGNSSIADGKEFQITIAGSVSRADKDGNLTCTDEIEQTLSLPEGSWWIPFVDPLSSCTDGLEHVGEGITITENTEFAQIEGDELDASEPSYM